MRKFSLLVALTLCGQPTEPPGLAAARTPVETWMGFKLVIYDPPAPIPGGPARFPQSPGPREARIAADSIVVSISQLRGFENGLELAEFLAHAAAHARLGHPNRMATLDKAMGILGPGRSGAALAASTRAEMEKQTAPVAAEFMQMSGCAPGDCSMFSLLLRAALQ